MLNQVFKKSFFIILAVMLVQSAGLAQEPDSTKSTEIKFFFYPFAFYTPETEIAIGAGVASYFRNKTDSLNQPSKVTLTGYYSFRKQYSFTLRPEFYFKQNNYRVFFELNFGDFADKFWVVGNDTPDIETADYMRQAYGILVNSQKRFLQQYRGGFIIEVKNSVIGDRKENPFLQSTELPGSDGGMTIGLGLSLAYDSRNSIFFPVMGSFIELQTTFYDKSIGSEFNYQRYLVNYRKYFSLTYNHAMAFQAFGNFTGGTVPFYELPYVGGPATMRGYFWGRYRDKHFMTVQLEYRSILFWRVGFAAFAGLGDVSDSFTSWPLSDFKHSLGAGVRYLVDPKEKLTVRIDLAFGKGSSGLYFAVEEAF
jgi:outer membrane protein assembly factor BamA